MKQELITHPSFTFIGIPLRTSNADPNVMQDIGMHWQRFYTEKIMEKIPGKIDNDVLAVYTEYEGDFKKPYTLILGCRVSGVGNVPEGLFAKTIPESKYAVFTAKGKMPDCIMECWKEIWSSDIERAYTNDFEVYGNKSHNPENAEIEIYISVK